MAYPNPPDVTVSNDDSQLISDKSFNAEGKPFESSSFHRPVLTAFILVLTKSTLITVPLMGMIT